VIIGEGEMVAGVQPAVVGMAEAVEFADVDHGRDLGRFAAASSVTRVTVICGIGMPKVAKVGTSTRVCAREGLSDVSDSVGPHSVQTCFVFLSAQFSGLKKRPHSRNALNAATLHAYARGGEREAQASRLRNRKACVSSASLNHSSRAVGQQFLNGGNG
jgi:hypothetical protein